MSTLEDVIDLRFHQLAHKIDLPSLLLHIERREREPDRAGRKREGEIGAGLLLERGEREEGRIWNIGKE